MGLGGLWHGANWTFVVWGLLHGLALAGTRLAHEVRGIAPSKPLVEGKLWHWFSVVVTFHFIVLTWIFFRAPDFGTAATILGGLLALPASLALPATGRLTLGFAVAALVLLAGLHSLSTWARARGVQNGLGWAVSRPVAYFLITAAVSLVADRGAQQFIYFQF
jgi:D-alanyl-lipoteichoic acid acyltransferase DltB (MBOAT superfamily)